MCVVGRELRINHVAGGKQAPYRGQVRDIGGDLAGEHRIAIEAELLGAFDLCVPIGALDQPDHHPAATRARGLDEPVDHRRAALLIRLHRHAEPVPAVERGLRQHHLDEIEREVQPVGLLGVDRQPDTGTLGLDRERPQPGGQLVDHPRALSELVARMKRRQLDRDAGCILDRPVSPGGADGLDCLVVGDQVARRVGGGQRRLAEHVEGVPIVEIGLVRGARQRFTDGPPHDELARHDAHRLHHRLADDRLARARDHTPEKPRKIRLAVVELDDPPGQQQAPGRRIDQHRIALPEMVAPLPARQLVADQPVDGLGIGDPEQRFGEAHQDDALVARQGVLVQERIQPAGQRIRRPRALDQAIGGMADAIARAGREARRGRQGLDRGAFVGQMGIADRRAELIDGRRLTDERHRLELPLNCLVYGVRRGPIPDRAGR